MTTELKCGDCGFFTNGITTSLVLMRPEFNGLPLCDDCVEARYKRYADRSIPATGLGG